MSSVRTRKRHQDLETIFGGGTLSALSDGQLLELFLGRRAEAGEQAFRTLVERHGPMVHRVSARSWEIATRLWTPSTRFIGVGSFFVERKNRHQ
jgi:hypothetical protein